MIDLDPVKISASRVLCFKERAAEGERLSSAPLIGVYQLFALLVNTVCVNFPSGAKAVRLRGGDTKLVFPGKTAADAGIPRNAQNIGRRFSGADSAMEAA